MREQDIPEEIDTLAVLPDRHLVRMKHETQLMRKIGVDGHQKYFKVSCAMRDDHEIIRVPEIVLDPECVFHELIKFIHVDICKELRREVPDGDAASWKLLSPRETVDDFFEERADARVIDLPTEHPLQNGMVNGGEEPVNVALEREARTGAIPADFPQHSFERIDATMSPLALATREEMRDERRLEDRIEGSEDGMVHDTVADGRFVDLALLGIADAERVILAVPVCPRCKVAV